MLLKIRDCLLFAKYHQIIEKLYTVLWYRIVANTILWSIFRLSSNTVQSQISPWFLHLEVIFETSEFSICTLFHRRYLWSYNWVKAFLKYIFYTFQDEEYREFSPYANFITANFITAFFKTITKIWLMRFYGLFILLVRT